MTLMFTLSDLISGLCTYAMIQEELICYKVWGFRGGVCPEYGVLACDAV